MGTITRIRPLNRITAAVAGFVAVRALFVILLLVLPQPVSAAYPKSQGYVNDFAGILNDPIRAALESDLRAVEQRTSAEIAVVTVPSLEGMTIDEYAVGLFADWKIGKRGKDNGVLVLVAPAERRVRIEVGYGLEPVLPDGLAGEIIRTEFLPAFRRGDFAGGIQAGVRDITEVVMRDQRFTPDDRRQPSARRVDQPPWIFLVTFFGLFVVIGAFTLGLGIGARSGFLLLFGIGFSAADVLMLTVIPMPVSALWSLRFLGLGMVVFGFTAGRTQSARTALKASSASGRGSSGSSGWTGGWTTDTSSSSSSSSTSSSSSDSSGSSGGDFGGGSSGGGGADGSW
jgi:uncharacterized protein